MGIHDTVEEKCEQIGWGRNRRGYLGKRKRWVIKIPKNDLGFLDNWHEDATYRDSPRGESCNGIVYARCRNFPKLGILVMEYVNEYALRGADRPYWSGLIDCGQIGLARDGRAKAFDYGKY